MDYEIKTSGRFDCDIEEVYDYISETLSNPFAAGRLLKAVEETVERISENPFLYPVYHDRELAVMGYRYTVINKKYDLLYTVDEDNKIIRIARFIYGGRDIENIIL